MRNLADPGARFADDHGDADPFVRERLARAEGLEGYLRAIAALGGARLLLPIVATGDEHTEVTGRLLSSEVPQPERHAEMAAVTLVDPELGTLLVAFTGLDALQAWNPQARPVPCTLDDLAATVGESGASQLLIDPAGPHPLVVGDDLVAELAQGRRLVELEGGGFGWAMPADSVNGRD